MQGQMSASVVNFPSQQRQLLTLLKDRVLRSTLFPRSSVKVGVSMHFNRICGCVSIVRHFIFSSLQSVQCIYSDTGQSACCELNLCSRPEHPHVVPPHRLCQTFRSRTIPGCRQRSNRISSEATALNVGLQRMQVQCACLHTPFILI